MNIIKKTKIIFLFIAIILAIFSIGYMGYTWRSSIKVISEHALLIAETSEIGLNGEMLKQLRAVPEDVGTIAYDSLKNRLMNLPNLDKNIRFAYIYIKKDDKLYFAVDSEPTTSTDYSPPGQEYVEADRTYFQPFSNGLSLITKPLTDRWGTWISILVPMKNADTGEIIAVFAIDYPAKGWNKEAYFNLIQASVVVTISFLLLFAFYKIINSRFKIKESEEKHRFLIENSHDIIYTLTKEGIFTFVSPAWTVLLGHPLDQVIGHPFQPFVHPDDVPRCMTFLRKVIETGKQQEGAEYRVRHLDGTWRWHISSATSLKNKIGTITGIEGTARDITERKKIEEEKAILTRDLEERVKELNCIYSIASIIEIPDISLEGILNKAIDVIQFGWRYPDIVCVRIAVNDKEYKTTNYKETKWKQTANIIVRGIKVGYIEVSYLEERPELYEGPFLEQEESLLINIAERLGRIVERLLAEEELRDSEEKIHFLLDSTAEAIYGIDLNGNCTFCNSACLHLLGYKKTEELIGKNMHWQIHSKHPDGTPFPVEECQIFQAFRNGKGTHVNNEVLWRSDGTFFDAEYWSYPLIRNGAVEGAVVTFLDITERKATEKEILELKNRDEAILNSIGDAVFATNNEGTILLFNKMAEDISGISAQKAIGKDYKQILPFIKESDGKPSNDFVAEAVRTGSTTKMANHTLLITKDGDQIPVADSASPIQNAQGMVMGCVVVFRDVTHEKEVDKAKTEFVSLASHQLRTPLTAINWYSEMLLAGDAGKLGGEQKKYLDEVYNAGQRMVALVDSFLDVSRLELGTFIIEPEPIDIAEVIKSVVNEQRPQIDEKKIKLSYSFAKNIPIMPADPKLLRMVIQNILSNSMKYTAEEGKIKISLTKNNLTKSVLIKVSDTGYGIPKGQQNKIFTKLFRADNIKEKDTGGTGLGLYIVKSIMDHSGGRVWFDSEENKGTTFYIEIPLSGMLKKEGTRRLN